MTLNCDKPKVLNMRHMGEHETGVSIMRPGLFGNMFIIPRDGDRNEVCDKFERYVAHNPDFQRLIKKQLRGQNLICCCKSPIKEVRCHGDTLLRVANEVDDSNYL